MQQQNGRSDELGRAFAGSQLQMQIYTARRSDALSQAVIGALGLDEASARIDWRSPREKDYFAEPMDGAFLQAVDVKDDERKLPAFWPASGPRWDALGLLDTGNGEPTILLVEAKSYPAEMFGSGCTASDPRSVALIDASLRRAKDYFGVDQAADWKGPLYQYANRLAHVYFLREVLGREAVLVNACFVGDAEPRSTTRGAWDTALQDVKRGLGFNGRAVPHTVDVFLPCHPRDLLLEPLAAVPVERGTPRT